MFKGADGISIYFLKGHIRMANMHENKHTRQTVHINNKTIIILPSTDPENVQLYFKRKQTKLEYEDFVKLQN